MGHNRPMAQSPAGKPRKPSKPAAPKKAAGSFASKPSATPKPAPAQRKKPAPPAPAAQEKRAPAKKAAAKSPSPALADTKPAPVKVPKPKVSPKAPSPKKGDTPPANEIDSKESTAQLGLTPKQQRFVDEFMVDLNATQAAIRAGYSPDTSRQMGAENLSKPVIQAAIADARRQQQERTGITADRVLREIAYVALADARELSQVVKGCCRHCWGEGHKRQRTVGEMNAAMAMWQKNGGMPADFDEEGGIGYNPHRPPHPDCPDCLGHGHAHVVIGDTRNLSPAALALYAGAKETKYGIEVLTHSKMAAIEMLNKHLGVYEKDNLQKADPLRALLDRITTEANNGFKPVAHDPEREADPGQQLDGGAFTPRQAAGDDDGDED